MGRDRNALISSIYEATAELKEHKLAVQVFFINVENTEEPFVCANINTLPSAFAAIEALFASMEFIKDKCPQVLPSVMVAVTKYIAENSKVPDNEG